MGRDCIGDVLGVLLPSRKSASYPFDSISYAIPLRAGSPSDARYVAIMRYAWLAPLLERRVGEPRSPRLSRSAKTHLFARGSDVACDLSRRIRMLSFYFKLRYLPTVVAEIRILRRGNRALRGYHAIRWINAVVRASCR
jgi:hypothetical protein